MSTSVIIDLSNSTESWVEIEYTYNKPEYCGGFRTVPGSIELHSVRVLDITGYNKDTRQVYSRHRSSFGAWRRDLDRVAFNEVKLRIDEWGYLAKLLVERA